MAGDRKNGPYDKVVFHGVRITRRQRQALNKAEQEIGMDFRAYQGSWRPHTSYSGYTHTKAGVCDLYVPRMDDDKWANYVLRVLRNTAKQAGYLRGPWNDMPYHYHVVDLDTKFMHPDAVWQVGQYRAPGGPYNALDAGVKDRNPYRPSPVRKWTFK